VPPAADQQPEDDCHLPDEGELAESGDQHQDL
jgi:hypothetical protein